MVALLASSSLGLAFPFFTGKLLDAAQIPVNAQSGGGSLSPINKTALILLSTLAVQAVFSFISSYGFN